MQNSHYSFALEGIGGSGKSHVGEILTENLTTGGLKVLNHKVAGLGSSPRVSLLKDIMWSRHKLKEEELTPKQLNDKLRDKIFRLAMRQQVKDLDKNNLLAYDAVIIDRTPLMIWVFAKSNNPNNPYLDEIYREVIFFTQKLNLSMVYLFDLSPETAYSRMIARYCIEKNNWEELAYDACKVIGSPADSTKLIFENVSKLIISKSIQPKEFESWDLIPFHVTQKERESHKQALYECNQRFGLNYQIIDAEKDIDTVVSSLYRSIILAMKSQEQFKHV